MYEAICLKYPIHLGGGKSSDIDLTTASPKVDAQLDLT